MVNQKQGEKNLTHHHCTVQKSTVQDTASVAKKGHEIREQLKEGEFSAKIVKS